MAYRQFAAMTAFAIVSALSLALASAQTAEWQMAAPLPKPIGEISGAVIGGKWFVLGGLDQATQQAARGGLRVRPIDRSVGGEEADAGPRPPPDDRAT